MDNKLFYVEADLEEMLEVKSSKAYEIINKLNEELETKGYLTFKGRVLASYFRQRIGLAA